MEWVHNKVKNKNRALRVTVRVTKYRKFQMTTPNFLLWQNDLHSEKSKMALN